MQINKSDYLFINLNNSCEITSLERSMILLEKVNHSYSNIFTQYQMCDIHLKNMAVFQLFHICKTWAQHEIIGNKQTVEHIFHENDSPHLFKLEQIKLTLQHIKIT